MYWFSIDNVIESQNNTIKMKTITLLFTFCIVIITLQAQEDVTIGKYKKFKSLVLGGEVTYLVSLPEGYGKYKKDYPVINMMNGQ